MNLAIINMNKHKNHVISSWQQTMDLFNQLRNIQNQDNFVNNLKSKHDPEIWGKVQKMLSVVDQTVTFFDKPMIDRIKTDTNINIDYYLGRCIAGYTITDLIARGGMGFVFRGHQSEPVERDVAIKIIKTETDEELSKWFKIEQQNLVTLNHPNIASVYDVGTSDDGISYIIMEEVNGLSIKEFCNKHRLKIKQRINLFIQVCKAIHYCHQRGIIHCDIKSSNILVRRINNEFIVKVIDFGLSSATGQTINFDKNQVQLIGTPEYMSPEFTDMDMLVDIRVDIFSLGTLFYSLLAGKMPFNRKQLVDDSIENTIDNIKNKKVISLIESYKEIDAKGQLGHADNCKTSIKKLKKQLSSDLNIICLKALQKNKDNRYQSINEMITDIYCFLESNPIKSIKNSWTYLTKKFINRHKLASGSTLLVLLLLLAFIITVVNQSEAIQQQYLITEKQRQIAVDEKKMANQVTTLMIDLFKSADPYNNQNNRPDIKKIIVEGIDKISNTKNIPQHIQNRILISISRIYTNLGYQDESLILLDKLYNDIKITDNGFKLSVMNLITENLSLSGENDKAIVQGLEAVNFVKHNFMDNEKYAHSKYILGTAFARADKLEKAILYLKESLNIFNSIDGSYDFKVMEIQEMIGSTLEALFRFEEAEKYLNSSLLLASDLYSINHLEYAKIEMSLASVLYHLNKHKEAIRYAEHSAKITLIKLGKMHPETISNRANLSTVYSNTGNFQKAIAIQILNLEAAKSYYGYESAEYLKHLTVLGNLYESLSQDKKALEIRIEAFRLTNKVIPNNKHLQGVIAFNMALSQYANKLFMPAINQLDYSIAIFKELYDENHILFGLVYSEKAKVYIDMGDFKQALITAEMALKIFDSQLPENNWRFVLTKGVRYYSSYKLSNNKFDLKSLKETYNQLVELGSGKLRYANLIASWLESIENSSQ